MPTHVVIFKVASSPFWWCRCYIGAKKYLVRSTKTDAKREAQVFAKQLYQDSLTNTVLPKHIKPKTFRAVALSLLESEKATAKRTLYVNDKSKLDTLLLDHFGNVTLDDIFHQDMNTLMVKLNKRNLSPATKKAYLSLVNKVFDHGTSLGVVTRKPLFPKLGEKLQTHRKRDYLTMGEYQKLSKTITTMASNDVIYRGSPITLEHKLLVNFMINSYIRPSDIRVIKHMHVVYQSDEERNYKWIKLTHPATKTSDQEVHTMPNTIDYYEELEAFRKSQYKAGKESSEYLKPNDYLFMPQYQNRDTAMEKLGKMFALIFKETRLKETTGKNLVLYSLRHTAIMYRLINSNVDLLALARNARTSPEVIDKNYGRHFTSEQARVKLHSFITDESQPRGK